MHSRSKLQSLPRIPSPRGTLLDWTSLTSLVALSGLGCQSGLIGNAQAQTPTPVPVQVVMNSHLDSEIQADDALMLREAIAFTNGTLNKADLSSTEQAQVTPSQDHNRIEFDLSSGKTTIRLESLLHRFSRLSINRVDLAATSSTGVQDYQVGDGPNPPRHSNQRQRDTANRGIHTPQFLSSEFFTLGNQVHVNGIADPGVRVILYEANEVKGNRGSLSEPLAVGVIDEGGRFTFTANNLQPGDRLSAIATHPEYGTSEPALNVVITRP